MQQSDPTPVKSIVVRVVVRIASEERTTLLNFQRAIFPQETFAKPNSGATQLADNRSKR
jgi:hypothetical protein